MVGRSIEGANLHRKELIALPGEAAILLLLLLAIASHFMKVYGMGFLHATALFVDVEGVLLIFNLRRWVIWDSLMSRCVCCVGSTLLENSSVKTIFVSNLSEN